jgi:hypothetical protein
MVNFYNTSQEIIKFMKKQQFDDIQLKILTSSSGKKQYFFLKKSSSFFDWEVFSSKFSSMFSTETVLWKQGIEVKPYFDSSVAFHGKIKRALKKAAYLGKGALHIEKQGYIPCMMEANYYTEMVSSHHLGMPFYKCLQKLYKCFVETSGLLLEFDLWLTTQDGQSAIKSVAENDQGQLTDLQITRLTAQTRKPYKVSFSKDPQGARILHQGSYLNTASFSTNSGQGKAIFVIGPDLCM